jgi:hypothetical protein
MVGELFDFRPFAFWCDGRDDVQALAARGFDEGLEVQMLHEGADFNGAGDELFPGQIRVGIEVDNDTVWLLEGFIARTPWVKLKDAHLRQTDEAFTLRHGDIQFSFGIAPLLHRNRHAVDSIRHALANLLLKKARLAAAFRTAHDADGTIGDVWKQMICDGFVILGEL